MSRFPQLADQIAAGLIKECPHCHCVWWPDQTTHRCVGMADAELAEAVRLLGNVRFDVATRSYDPTDDLDQIDAFLAKHKETK